MASNVQWRETDWYKGVGTFYEGWHQCADCKKRLFAQTHNFECQDIVSQRRPSHYYITGERAAPDVIVTLCKNYEKKVIGKWSKNETTK